MPENNTIYLDNAATSYPKPPAVYEAMASFLKTHGANPGRAGHRMAVETEEAIDRARLALARLFGIKDSKRIIFTLNCTDALNIAIKGLLAQGDHVITTVLEHNSISRPLVRMEREGFISLTRVGCSDTGYVYPEDIRKALNPRTRLVAMTHGSNVLGTVQPVREVGAIAHEAGAVLLVDAAQTAGVLPLDVTADNIDLLAFAGHKSLYGPPGTGGLYVSDEVALQAWREGGTGGDSSSPVQPEEFPFYLEGGTPNTVGIEGLRAGADFIATTGVATIHNHEISLRRRMRDALVDDDRFIIYGPTGDEPVTAPLSIGLRDLAPELVGAVLDQSFRIAARSGLHCAPYIHRHLGTFPDGTVRLSPGYFTTLEELDATVNALKDVAEQAIGL